MTHLRVGLCPPTLLRPLTAAERDVLACIAAGDTDEEAAVALGWSPHTVRSYVRNIASILPDHWLTPMRAMARRRVEFYAVAVRLQQMGDDDETARYVRQGLGAA
jgi:DNA-binding NarL/FixJ family response regulator